jgi:hypothetical protein
MAQTAATPSARELDGGPATTGEVVAPAFIAEQTAGSLVRNTLTLYRSSFRPLFLTYFLPTFPILVLQQVADGTGNVGLFLATALAGWVVSFLATSALTVVISDICLGNEPTVRRAYARLLKAGLWLRVLLTGLLQIAAVVAGFILLVIPGLVLMVRLLPCSTVVVLEGTAGTKALKRSLHLTKGHYWRLFGLLLLVTAIIFAALLVAMLGLGLLLLGLGHLFDAPRLDLAIAILLGALMQGVLYPMFFIAIVLLYYDLRARKEAYDVETLSEDMMR